MSVYCSNIGPRLIEDGLLMYFDASNPLSFAGGPTTNLMTKIDFNDWSAYTAKNIEVYGTGISGETAYKVYDTSSTEYHGVQLGSSTVSVTGGETYTLSLWFLKNSYATARSHFRIVPNAGGGLLSLRLNNDLGTVNIARQDALVTSISSGICEEKIIDSLIWRRGYTTFTLDASISNVDVELLVAHDNLSNSANSSNTGSAIVCCPQIENNSYPTSFISGSRSATNCFRDLTINRFTGSFVNLPSESFDRKGSINFNGTNQYIQIPNTSVVNPYSGSISMWFMTENPANSQMPVYIAGTGTNRYYIQVSSNTIRVFRGTNLSDVIVVNSSPNSNEWYNITMTYDSSSFYGYCDGVYVGTRGYTGSANFGTSIYLGSQAGSSQPLTGKIAAFYMYDRRLSAEEVKQNYEQMKSKFK